MNMRTEEKERNIKRAAFSVISVCSQIKLSYSKNRDKRIKDKEFQWIFNVNRCSRIVAHIRKNRTFVWHLMSPEIKMTEHINEHISFMNLNFEKIEKH